MQAAGLHCASSGGLTRNHAAEEVGVEVVILGLIKPVVKEAIIEAAVEEAALGMVPLLGPLFSVATLKHLYGKLVNTIVEEAISAHVQWIMAYCKLLSDKASAAARMTSHAL